MELDYCRAPRNWEESSSLQTSLKVESVEKTNAPLPPSSRNPVEDSDDESRRKKRRREEKKHEKHEKGEKRYARDSDDRRKHSRGSDDSRKHYRDSNDKRKHNKDEEKRRHESWLNGLTFKCTSLCLYDSVFIKLTSLFSLFKWKNLLLYSCLRREILKMTHLWARAK